MYASALHFVCGVMLPGLASPLGIFLLRGFMQQLPADLDNAARLDGASEWFILARIVAPLCKPALVALACFIMNLAARPHFQSHLH